MKQLFYNEIQFTYHQKLISLFYVDFCIRSLEKSMFISTSQTASVFVIDQPLLCGFLYKVTRKEHVHIDLSDCQCFCHCTVTSTGPFFSFALRTRVPLSFIDTQHRKQQTKLETEVKSVNKKHITTFTFRSFTSEIQADRLSESISAQN